MNSCASEGKSTLDIIECFLVNNLYLVGSIEILLFIGISYYIYKYDPLHLVKHHYPYLIILLLLIGFIFFIYFYFLKKRKENFGKLNPNPKPNDKNFKNPLLLLIGKIASIFGITIGGILIITSIFWLFNNITILGKLAIYSLIAISIVIVLAFIYIIFNVFLKPYFQNDLTKVASNKDTILAFIVKLVFYFPCLLINLIDYAKKQYKITTRNEFILLIIELIIIVFYFLIPFLVKNISFHEGKQLLKGPVYTNNLTNLGTYENLTNKSEKDRFNYNYGLSFWLYINPQPPNTNSSYTEYTSLFNYANKPNILYNGKKNSLKVICQNKKNDLVTIYETNNIKYQKWNHFIVNYDGGTIDLFINNELVASKPGIAPYMRLDNVTAGHFDGVHGGIKDVVYFNRIIPPNKVMLLFNSEGDNVKNQLKNSPEFIKKGERYLSKEFSNFKNDILEIKDDFKKENEFDSKENSKENSEESSKENSKN